MPQMLIPPVAGTRRADRVPKRTKHTMTRAMLRVARTLVRMLEAEDRRTRLAAGEPGAYAYVHDQIARLMADHPDPPHPRDVAYGQPVRLRCGATGRYIAGGYGLYVSAMDNSLNLDQIDREREPAHGLPMPSDSACEAAAATFTILMPEEY